MDLEIVITGGTGMTIFSVISDNKLGNMTPLVFQECYDGFKDITFGFHIV